MDRIVSATPTAPRKNKTVWKRKTLQMSPTEAMTDAIWLSVRKATPRKDVLAVRIQVPRINATRPEIAQATAPAKVPASMQTAQERNCAPPKIIAATPENPTVLADFAKNCLCVSSNVTLSTEATVEQFSFSLVWTDESSLMASPKETVVIVRSGKSIINRCSSLSCPR
jgi:hypothetical protein